MDARKILGLVALVTCIMWVQGVVWGALFFNPGFEGTYLDGQIADGDWVHLEDGDTDFYEETTIVYGGSKAQGVKNNVGLDGTSFLYQWVYDLDDEKVYKLEGSYYAKTTSASYYIAWLVLRFEGPGTSNVIAKLDFSGDPVGSWVTRSIIFSPPRDGTYVVEAINFGWRGDWDVVWDDISLTVDPQEQDCDEIFNEIFYLPPGIARAQESLSKNPNAVKVQGKLVP